MAIKLEFVKEKVVLTPTMFMFKPFVDLWEWDTSSNKDRAHAMFYFLYLLNDLSELNPLRDTAPDKKEAEALRLAFKSTKKFTKAELKVLDPAIKCYITYNNTAEERILKEFDSKAEQIRQQLEDTVPETLSNERRGVISFVSNSSIITKALKELDGIKRAKLQVVAAIKKETMSQKVRGQIVLSPLSKGQIQLPSITD